MSTRETWRERPPVVVVCPRCDSGIYQHRYNRLIDCPDCEYATEDDYLTKYDIVRFDCPDCGADLVEEWATHDLVGDGPPNTVVSVWCNQCGMRWEAPHE